MLPFQLSNNFVPTGMPISFPFVPGTAVPNKASIDKSAEVPGTGKTVGQILEEFRNPKPGQMNAGITLDMLNRGEKPIMAEPGYKPNWASDLLGDLYDLYADAYNNVTESKEDSPNDDPVTPPSSAREYASSPINPVIDYLNADLAKHYGMSKETAYQEALSNTAYRRAIVDMQNAGLNPASIFGAGRSSGSSGVSYVADNVAQGFGASGKAKTDNGILFDTEFMESVGSLISVALGESASSGKATGKAISVIAQKLANLSK